VAFSISFASCAIRYGHDHVLVADRHFLLRPSRRRGECSEQQSTNDAFHAIPLLPIQDVRPRAPTGAREPFASKLLERLAQDVADQIDMRALGRSAAAQ
jgi:hypothetical protein